MSEPCLPILMLQLGGLQRQCHREEQKQEASVRQGILYWNKASKVGTMVQKKQPPETKVESRPN